jgi:hypothetical protein
MDTAVYPGLTPSVYTKDRVTWAGEGVYQVFTYSSLDEVGHVGLGARGTGYFRKFVLGIVLSTENEIALSYIWSE